MTDPSAPPNINRNRLFNGICLALIPTGASFAIISNVMGQLKAEFILTNAQVGAIGGAALWGMALSLLILGPLLEGLGMKKATWLAFLGHTVGLTLMIAASRLTGNPESAYWLLMLGAACLAGGNGMIEVAGNPLTTALFPEDKSRKLNIFHAFFPVAILVAGLICWCLNQTQNIANGFFYHWTFQLAIVYIPVIIYGILVLPQKFPKTENAEAGLPVKEMFRYTFTSPLMYLLLIMMGIAIGTELGVNRWIPPIFGSIGLPGVLMMSWIAFVMMMLRFFAGTFIEKLSPPGMLAGSSIFTALGLVLFGIAQNNAVAFLAATFFAFGVAFFFPTIVGLVAERLPKTGSLGIVLTCGFGLGAAGLIGAPGIGAVADKQLSNYLDEERRGVTTAVLQAVEETFPTYRQQAEEAEDPIQQYGFVASDIGVALKHSSDALAAFNEADRRIVGSAAPQALRAISASTLPASEAIATEADQLLAFPQPDAAAVGAFASAGASNSAVLAGKILGPAEGFGGQRALLLIAWVPLILTVFFGMMYLNDKRRGGYKAVRLERSHH